MHPSTATRSYIHPVLCRVLWSVVILSSLSACDVFAGGFIAFGSASLHAGAYGAPLDLTFQGPVGLAGLQWTIVGTPGVVHFIGVERGEIIISSAAWGFDYSINPSGDTLRAVLWSRSRSALSEATYPALVRIIVSPPATEPLSLILQDVQSVLADGQGSPANIVIGSPSSVEIVAEEQTKEPLSQNFPNPCNPSTSVRYVVPVKGRVTLRVYNILGQEVRTVIDDVVDAGGFEAVFSMEGLPSGVYLYRFSGSGFESVRKMTLLK